MKTRNNRVAVVKWRASDGVASAIANELSCLGYSPLFFMWDEDIPNGVSFVFSFAPYGRFLPLARRAAGIAPEMRPLLIHWNFESLPDISLPWPMLAFLSSVRTWVDRLNFIDNSGVKNILRKKHFPLLNERINKFRYLGDYHFAYRQGWVHLLADISIIFASYHSNHGVETKYIPWGTPKSWYADLALDRDIDVLWMGKRRTKRRSILLDQLSCQLRDCGIQIFIADNVENPFIFGEERTEFLNRAKITINLLPTIYDPAFIFRFHMAAGNRSLVISEPILPHCPTHKAGENYIEAPVNKLTESILYYLQNESERLRIVENAYGLVTTQLTLQNSIRRIMNIVDPLNCAQIPASEIPTA